MSPYGFEDLLIYRKNLWNSRMPSQCRVEVEVFNKHDSAKCFCIIRDSNGFVGRLSYKGYMRHSGCETLLDDFVNMLENHFVMREHPEFDANTVTATKLSELEKSYLKRDAKTSAEICAEMYIRLFGPEWKKWKAKIDRVIFNDPATIILWKDGTKTVVKCGPNDIYDKEKGLAMALCKYVLGNKGNFNRFFKSFMEEDK